MGIDMARPSKITPEAQAEIVKAVRLGASYELAASCGGVTYETMNNWRKRGEQEEERRRNEKFWKAEEGTSETPFLLFCEELAIAKKEFLDSTIANEKERRENLPKGKLDKKQRYLYIVRETWQGMCKIGIASDIYARMSSLQTGCPQELEVIGFVALKNAKSMELFIHNRYKAFRHRGEWFNLSIEQVQTILDFVNAETLIEKGSHAVVGHNYSFNFGKKD